LFTLEEIQLFRTQNQNFQELERFKKQNLKKYEDFALWTEYFLSEKFCLKNMFEKKI